MAAPKRKGFPMGNYQQGQRHGNVVAKIADQSFPLDPDARALIPEVSMAPNDGDEKGQAVPFANQSDLRSGR